MNNNELLYHIKEYFGILFSVLFNVWVWILVVCVFIDIIVLPLTLVVTMLRDDDSWMFALSVSVIDKVSESLLD